jgi:hypothetical protein
MPLDLFTICIYGLFGCARFHPDLPPPVTTSMTTTFLAGSHQSRSAEHLLGSLEEPRFRAERVLGAPVAFAGRSLRQLVLPTAYSSAFRFPLSAFRFILARCSIR